MSVHISFSVGATGSAGARALYDTKERATLGEKERVWTEHVPQHVDHPERGADYKERRANLVEYARQLDEDEIERGHAGKGKTRSYYRAIYSFHKEVDDEKAKEMIRAHQRECFPKARIINSLHKNTQRTHVHSIIFARQTDGQKLQLGHKAYREIDERWARIYGREFGAHLEREHLHKKEERREHRVAARRARLEGREPPPRPERVTHERNQLAEKLNISRRERGTPTYDKGRVRRDQRPTPAQAQRAGGRERRPAPALVTGRSVEGAPGAGVIDLRDKARERVSVPGGRPAILRGQTPDGTEHHRAAGDGLSGGARGDGERIGPQGERGGAQSIGGGAGEDRSLGLRPGEGREDIQVEQTGAAPRGIAYRSPRTESPGQPFDRKTAGQDQVFLRSAGRAEQASALARTLGPNGGTPHNNDFLMGTGHDGPVRSALDQELDVALMPLRKQYEKERALEQEKEMGERIGQEQQPLLPQPEQVREAQEIERAAEKTIDIVLEL